MESVNLDEDASAKQKAKEPPNETEAPAKRQTQPSMTVEQAAKPVFNITVGDPHKVGDLTSSHIVYQVRTKVCSVCEIALAHVLAISLNVDLITDYVKGLHQSRICCQ